jgi:hypothetical protein
MIRVLLDTNVLLFALTHSVSPEHAIGRRQWKRLRGYSAEQVDVLAAAVGSSPEYVTLPHILTEASNLLVSRGGEAYPGAVAALQAFVRQAHEVTVPSIEATMHQTFRWLGLTDVAILLCGEGMRVVTGDGPAHRACVEAGLDAVNVWHPLTPR